MSQYDTYLKEKEEAVQATKNLEESHGQKISELQEDISLKDKQLDSAQDEITKDRDNIKNAQLEAENLRNEFQQLDSSVLGNVHLNLLCVFVYKLSVIFLTLSYFCGFHQLLWASTRLLQPSPAQAELLKPGSSSRTSLLPPRAWRSPSVCAIRARPLLQRCW